ncbi:hypothetical protein E2P81_ATG02867 [Venturia nashicola]|nr:hypothetical protein E2P81_ATG02867 [Venturia nashicola]
MIIPSELGMAPIIEFELFEGGGGQTLKRQKVAYAKFTLPSATSSVPRFVSQLNSFHLLSVADPQHETSAIPYGVPQAAEIFIMRAQQGMTAANIPRVPTASNSDLDHMTAVPFQASEYPGVRSPSPNTVNPRRLSLIIHRNIQQNA